MVICEYIKKFVKIEHRWFCSMEEEINSDADIIYLHGVTMVPSNWKGECSMQRSVVKDLSMSEADLFLTLGKHLRQYIKRSTREDVEITIYDSVSFLANDGLVERIGMLYEKMYADKNIKTRFNYALTRAYAKNNSLCIAIASVGGRLVGFDAVICDDKHARLWLAAFDFRNESEDSQKLSRAHQRMDWELLVWCKNRGIIDFDFGGIASFENPNGIDGFKMKFESNNKVEYYNVILPNSILGKFLLKCKKLFLKSR